MALEVLAGKDVATRKARLKRMSRVGSFVGTDKSLRKVLSKTFKHAHNIGDKFASGKGGDLRGGRRAVGAAAAVVVGAASAAAAAAVAVVDSAS